MANSALIAHQSAGATSNTYTVPSSDTAQSNDGDNYYVIVSNGYGTALSNRAMLTVGEGISMNISAPTTQYIPVDTLASYTVTASCDGCVPAYQWYWYAPGATTATAPTDGAVSSGALNGATISGSAQFPRLCKTSRAPLLPESSTS